jgi:hypothetical protein
MLGMVATIGGRYPENIMRLQKLPPANRANIETTPQRTEDAMSNDTMTRIFGGSPLAVLGRLVLVSILVGVILSALGLDPFDIIRSVRKLIESIWNLGFDAFHWLWRYFLLGAAIVIPIWLIMRLVNAPRGK